MKPIITCRTITMDEFAREWSQPADQILCPKCSEEGRHNFERHLRERFGQYCPCCRRRYQMDYYRAKRGQESPLATVKKERVAKLRKQADVWFQTGNPDVIAQLKQDILPELNGLEGELKLDVTTEQVLRVNAYTALAEQINQRNDAGERLRALMQQEAK